MAFIALTAAEIAVGEATKQQLFQKEKDNFDDHESRITATESAVNLFRPIEFNFQEQAIIQDEVAIVRMNFAATVLAARIFLIDSGSSGTLIIDIEKSTNGGASFSTIFSTLPSVSNSDGDYFLSTNQVLSVTSFAAGDFMRVNIDAIITGSDLFQVFVEFEVS